jgi:hypothetical protein
MRKPGLLVAACLSLLAGCASNVQKSDESPPTRIGASSGKTIVLNMTGSTVATTAKDWNDFKSLWREPCTHESTVVGDTFSIQDGEAKPTGQDGTLVVVDVADYRYVSGGTRIMFGVMTGNAYINAHVTFRDLKSGEVRSTKTYDTTSSAWEGVFAGMTTKQVSAMCHQIFVDIAQ